MKATTRICGKVALTASIALLGLIAMTGCTTDPATGETTFAPLEALKGAAETVANIPDETKANALEGLAMLLGATGIGACAVPALKAGSNYFKNKSKKKKAEAEAEESSDAGGGGDA